MTTPYAAALARDTGRAGAGDERLGRDAADVDAGAAEALAFDDRSLAARAGQADRQRGPAWPAPITIASKSSIIGMPFG